MTKISLLRVFYKKSGLQESGATEGRKNKNKTKIKRVTKNKKILTCFEIGSSRLEKKFQLP